MCLRTSPRRRRTSLPIATTSPARRASTRVLPRPRTSRARLPSPPAPDVAATAVANIGVVGLAVMGSNLARNLASREGNTVAIYNRSREKTDIVLSEHPEAEFVPAYTYAEFAASLQKPRTAIIMVKAGAGHGCRHRRARGRLRAGRHHRRRRQRPLHRHDPPREGRARDRHQLRRRRHLRRRGGRAARPLDHARRLGRVVGHARTDPEVDRRDRRGRALRDARRPRRRRPLREDGPQRHRVRRHAAHRRGVRPHPPRHRQVPRRDRRRLRRVERAASSSRT